MNKENKQVKSDGTGNLIFVDVEAGNEDGNGISPASGVMTEFGAVHYKTGEKFYGKLYDCKPHPDNPAMSIPIKHVGDKREAEIMQEFADWIKECGTTPNGRAVFISDNPAYDFQWINYYFDKHGMKNPFGHSARRIGDFYAGVVGDFKASSKWKKFRITKHDHNPVHDSQGNVEAFRKIMQEILPGNNKDN